MKVLKVMKIGHISLVMIETVFSGLNHFYTYKLFRWKFIVLFLLTVREYKCKTIELFVLNS